MVGSFDELKEIQMCGFGFCYTVFENTENLVSAGRVSVIENDVERRI